MKALALFSGGLDSTLAMKLIIDQGIEVIAVNVNFGFGSTKDKTSHLESMCNQVGAKLEILDLRQEYLDEVLFSPKYGYGSAYNPCIDCHGFMFRYTKKLLEKYNASFMISGEVVGQRPMSQRKDAMDKVQALSEDIDDIILRPLCAKNLPITKPEREAWVNREKLLDIQGRGRNVQLELAKKYNITDFEKPGGGCMLTEKNTAIRIKEFLANEKDMEVEDIIPLKYGRHLRLPNKARLIVGRHQEDNEQLKKSISKRYHPINLIKTKGPFSLISKNASLEDINLALKIVLTYAKTEPENEYSVNIDDKIYTSKPFESKELVKSYFIN